MECDICKKSEFDGTVYYFEEEYHLCRSHYMKWNKHHKPYVEDHKEVKPNTKEWTKMCKEEERLFKRWYAQQKTKQVSSNEGA